MGIVDNILDKNSLVNRLARMTGDVPQKERVCPFCGKKMIFNKNKKFYQCPSYGKGKPCWLGD